METAKDLIERLNTMDNSPGTGLIEPVQDLIEPVRERLLNQLPSELKDMVEQIGKRTSSDEKISKAIIALCTCKPLKISEISIIIGRGEKYILYNFVKPLREKRKLVYTIPDMPNHPEQAYTANKQK